jgi:hypothetical protein
MHPLVRFLFFQTLVETVLPTLTGNLRSAIRGFRPALKNQLTQEQNKTTRHSIFGVKFGPNLSVFKYIGQK